MKKISWILAFVIVIQSIFVIQIPASAWAWETDGMYQVPSYDAAIVKDGSINVDAVLDYGYLSSTKITEYPEAVPYTRSGYSSVVNDAKGNFEAYVVADTKGMFIYAKISDSTIFDTVNSNGNDGDYFSIYFDWLETHPAPEDRSSSWSAADYMNTYGKDQNLGWLSADYHGNIAGSRGFKSYTKFGPNKNQSILYEAKIVDGGWACEWFIPWKDQAQMDAIARGEQIPCGIGFQVGDDSDINNIVTPDKEQDVVIRFDQRKEMAIGYYLDYSKLANVNFIKHEESYHVCTSSGLADVYCEECDIIIAENVSVSVDSGTPESHVYIWSTTSTDATCTKIGKDIFECKYCDATKETEIPASGHSYTYNKREARHICNLCRARVDHGDANGDGKITNADVLEMYRYIYNSTTYPIDYPEIADANFDGDITNADVLVLFRYIYNPRLYPIVEKQDAVVVDGINLSDYVIIYPTENTLKEKALAEELAARIKDKYGLEMEIYADSVDIFEHEIIIGRADRDEADQVYSSTFDDDKYSISVGDKKIVVGFADNKFAAEKAVEDIENMFTVSCSISSKTAKAVAQKVLTSFMFTDVHNNFAMLEPTNNTGDYIVRKNVDMAIDHLLATTGPVDVVLVGGDLISDYHSWNKSGKWPYEYFLDYREILVNTFKRLSKDGKVSYVAGNHDYAQGELATDGPGKNGSYNSFDFYFGDVGMRQDWGELPEEDMFVKIGEKTGEKYLLAYYYEVNGVGFVGLSADHDTVWSSQGSGFDEKCLEWLDKKLDEVDPDGDKVIIVNCHYFIDHRTGINADGSNKYSNTTGYDKNALTPIFLGHKNLYHIFGHGEVWFSDTTVRYVSHHNLKGNVIDVTNKETDSSQIVSYENRDFTSIYGGHFRPDANSHPQWFEKDYVTGYAGLSEYGYTHRSTCTPKVAQGLYFEVFEDRIVFTMKNFGDYEGYKTTDLITPYTVWLYK